MHCMDHTFDFNSPGFSVDPSAARLNSRCIRSTIVASATLDVSRSALPNRTPLIAQSASKPAFGVCRCTMTPTKPLHLGSAFLTALAIADCKRSRETELRLSDGFFRCQAKTTSAGKEIRLIHQMFFSAEFEKRKGRISDRTRGSGSNGRTVLLKSSCDCRRPRQPYRLAETAPNDCNPRMFDAIRTCATPCHRNRVRELNLEN
jgi:hypothetical protein